VGFFFFLAIGYLLILSLIKQFDYIDNCSRNYYKSQWAELPFSCQSEYR
jgi:hypothetical protein